MVKGEPAKQSVVVSDRRQLDCRVVAILAMSHCFKFAPILPWDSVTGNNRGCRTPKLFYVNRRTARAIIYSGVTKAVVHLVFL